MSFIGNVEQGNIYAPGWFLAHEECERKTRQVTQSMATTRADGAKYVPMGTPYPSNDGNCIGFVYEDVDVTSGSMPASVVLSGVVYEDRLPVDLEDSAKSALTRFEFKDEPPVSRPVFPSSLKSISVASAAGTTSGTTKLTLTYTKADDESYMYKVATGTAPSVKPAEIPDNTWTAWNGTSDITAATDKKITVIAVNAAGESVASGSATVTAKA